MKFTGGLYIGKDNRKYLALYNYQHDVFMMPPPPFENATHVDHFSHSRGGRKGGADVFLLEGDFQESSWVTLNKTVSLKGKVIDIKIKNLKRDEKDKRRKNRRVKLESFATTPKKYDVQHQILNVPLEIQKEIIALGDADIDVFCNDLIAKNPRGAKVEVVERIISKTELKKIEYDNKMGMLRLGKQLNVPDCIYPANIDFMQGCISSWIPGKNASFDGEFFTDFWSFIPGECIYCYASRDHNCFPKTIYKFDEKRLREELQGDFRCDFNDKDIRLGRHLDFLRFGKRTEPWTEYTRDAFVRTLELMLESGTRGVITSKTLEFDKTISDLVKRTGSQILFSIGDDEYEKGMVMRGFDNQFREEQAMKYYKDKSNIGLYLLIQGHKGIKQKEKRVINLGLPVQLLPFNFKTKDALEVITGYSSEELRGGKKRKKEQRFLPIYGDDPYGAYAFYNNAYRLQRVHPDWLKLIEENNGKIRMCHHTLDDTYCGTCFLGDGMINGPPHKNENYFK